MRSTEMGMRLLVGVLLTALAAAQLPFGAIQGSIVQVYYRTSGSTESWRFLSKYSVVAPRIISEKFNNVWYTQFDEVYYQTSNETLKREYLFSFQGSYDLSKYIESSYHLMIVADTGVVDCSDRLSISTVFGSKNDLLQSSCEFGNPSTVSGSYELNVTIEYTMMTNSLAFLTGDDFFNVVLQNEDGILQLDFASVFYYVPDTSSLALRTSNAPKTLILQLATQDFFIDKPGFKNCGPSSSCFATLLTDSAINICGFAFIRCRSRTGDISTLSLILWDDGVTINIDPAELNQIPYVILARFDAANIIAGVPCNSNPTISRLHLQELVLPVGWTSIFSCFRTSLEELTISSVQGTLKITEVSFFMELENLKSLEIQSTPISGSLDDIDLPEFTGNLNRIFIENSELIASSETIQKLLKANIDAGSSAFDVLLNDNHLYGIWNWDSVEGSAYRTSIYCDSTESNQLKLLGNHIVYNSDIVICPFIFVKRNPSVIFDDNVPLSTNYALSNEFIVSLYERNAAFAISFSNSIQIATDIAMISPTSIETANLAIVGFESDSSDIRIGLPPQTNSFSELYNLYNHPKNESIYVSANIDNYVQIFRIIPSPNCSSSDLELNPTKGYCGCLPGFYSEDEDKNCQSCQRGRYTDVAAQTSCSNCREGTYQKSANSTNCSPCPSEGYCAEGSWRPVARQGFWFDPNLQALVKCIISEACTDSCVGKEDWENCDNCAVGYEGASCSSCAQQYYRSEGRCKKCPSAAAGMVVVLVMLVWLLCFVFWATGSPKLTGMHSLSIIIGWVQMIALFGSLPSRWPKSMENLFQFFKFWNLDLELFSPECSLSLGYWEKWTLKLLFPVFLLVGFILCGVTIQLVILCKPHFKSLFSLRFAEFYSNYKDLSPVLANRTDKYFKTRPFYGFFNVMLLAQVLLASTATEPFNCIEIAPNVYVIEKEPSEYCYRESWDKHFAGAVFAAVFYMILFPLFYLSILLVNRKKFHDSSFLKYFGMLTVPYRFETPYWEMVNILRKNIFVVLINFLSTRQTLKFQIFIIILFLVIYLFLHSTFRPYRVKGNNTLTTTWSIATLLCMFTGVLFDGSLSRTEENTYAGVAIFAVTLAFLVSVHAVYLEIEENKTTRTLEAKTGKSAFEVRLEKKKQVLNAFPNSRLKVWQSMCYEDLKSQKLFFADVAKIIQDSKPQEEVAGEVQTFGMNEFMSTDNFATTKVTAIVLED